MSHQPERSQKDCLNCGTEVQGRFCQHCGQENTLTHQNFWSLAQHFIFDIFHFDGKFFDTLKGMIFKPGKVAREYVAGRRMSYLDPIRMYLFTSAVFFLILFTFKGVDFENNTKYYRELNTTDRLHLAMDLHAKVRDSTVFYYGAALDKVLDSTNRIILRKPDSTHVDSLIFFQGKTYWLQVREKEVQLDTDSLKKKSWLDRKIEQKVESVGKKYEGNTSEALRVLLETFYHRLPYLLFVSLPFFALILKLLYRRRKVVYADHVVFTLYHYIFSFILLLLIGGLSAIKNWLHWGFISWITFLLFMAWFIHFYKAMRTFYGQGRKKTILKFFLLNFLGSILIVLLFLIFLAVTAFQF